MPDVLQEGSIRSAQSAHRPWVSRPSTEGEGEGLRIAVVKDHGESHDQTEAEGQAVATTVSVPFD